MACFHRTSHCLRVCVCASSPALGNSGAELDTGTGVVVPLLLQFVEMAVPHLVRLARVPGVHAVTVGTQITDLVARRGVPGVEQRVGERLCQLVANGGRRRVRRDGPVRYRGAKDLTGAGVAKGLIRVDDGGTPAVKVPMVGAVLHVRAGRRTGIKTRPLPAGGKEEEHLVEPARPPL